MGDNDWSASQRSHASCQVTAALLDRDRGLPIASDKLTLGQYLTGWLEANKHQLKPGSWSRNEEIVRRHIVLRLGKLALSKITPQDLQRLYAAKLDEGLSRTSVHYVHRTLHRALAEADRQGAMPRNVARLVTPLRRDEMHVLDSAQVRQLLEVSREHRLQALFVLTVHTGMRVGELQAQSGRISVLCSALRLAGRSTGSTCCDTSFTRCSKPPVFH